MSKICSTGPTIHRIRHCIQMFWKNSNNCWETKLSKNAICLLSKNLKIHNLVTLLPGRPSCRVVRNWFVNNKQMAFLLSFVSHQSLCLFSKHLDTTLNVTDCGTGQTDLCLEGKHHAITIYEPGNQRYCQIFDGWNILDNFFY